MNNTNIIGENPFRSQKGTNLYVDNIKIPESDLNVDEMYSQGVMKMKNDFRYEIKFVANEMNYSIFNEWFFSQSDFFKSYPERQINSLYFDDNDFTSVKDNLSGIANRKNKIEEVKQYSKQK